MAGKKRGLSLEEKRTKMLEIFYEKKDVFQLKELEKLGPAEKGVISQSVKEIVQSLVDDGYVDSERVGTSQYFWAFPSKAMQTRKRKLDWCENREAELDLKYNLELAEVNAAKMCRAENPERGEALAAVNEGRVENERLKQALDQFRDSDPEVIRQEKEDISTFVTCANRWTDNIFAFRSWLKEKFSMSETEINNSFQIPEDLEYVEPSAEVE